MESIDLSSLGITLREKEDNKHLRILEADTIKQIKGKIRKSTSDERENFSKPSSASEIPSKK